MVHLERQLGDVYRRLWLMMTPEAHEAELANFRAEWDAKEKLKKWRVRAGAVTLGVLVALVIGAYVVFG
jgi:hypothetical protein